MRQIARYNSSNSNTCISQWFWAHEHWGQTGKAYHNPAQETIWNNQFSQ